MLNLILFGPPGGGKGTQAAHLTEKYCLKHISTGDLLRSECSNKTPLGIEAQKFMGAGQLVPDTIIIGMVENVLDTNAGKVEGYIFDGFPRTVAQAIALDELLLKKGSNITKMLALEVSEEELIARLLLRGKTSGRSDDNIETIKKRIQVYKDQTSPVAEYYNGLGKAVTIKGEGSIANITAALSAEIDVLV